MKKLLPRALGAAMLGLLAGCAVDGGSSAQDESALAPLSPGPDDDVSKTPWQPIGVGVSYKSFADAPASATNVLLVYGGYTAEDEWVQRWTDELYRMKGAALGLGHLYAVKGPNEPGYANREIQNRKLSIHLAADDRAANARRIVVIAHSSGTYVADELFSMVDTSSGLSEDSAPDAESATPGIPPDTLSKIAFFDLDGGAPNDGRVRRFASAHFVFACDHGIGRCSHNSSGMRSLGSEYASLGGAFEVDASNSRCDAHAAGGLWCLHDTMITTWPHNPLSYDLLRDYTDFTGGRRLVTSYLDVLH